MLTKSKNIYHASTAYSSAVPGTNGGKKTLGAGESVIAATATGASFLLKRADLNATTGNGIWTSAVPSTLTAGGDIALQVDVTLAAVAGADAASGQKLNVYYAFSTDDLITADNAEDWLLVRNILFPTAKVLSISLPAVTSDTAVRRIYNTDRVSVRGQFLYVWIEHGPITFDNVGASSLAVQVNAIA